MEQKGIDITYQTILKNIQENQFAQPKLFRKAAQNKLKNVNKSHNELIERYIVPNSVLEGQLISFELLNESKQEGQNKMQSIRVKLQKFKALAHSGKHLYQPYSRHGYLYEDGGYSQRESIEPDEFDHFADRIRANHDLLFNNEIQLEGSIEESRHIYDTKMPHFAYEIDKLQ